MGHSAWPATVLLIVEGAMLQTAAARFGVAIFLIVQCRACNVKCLVVSHSLLHPRHCKHLFKTGFEAAYRAHVEVDKTLCVTAMTLAVQQSMVVRAGVTACGTGGQDNYRKVST